MKNEIKLYDYLNFMMRSNMRQQKFKSFQLNYLISEIMNNLKIIDTNEIEIALQRTFDVCDSLQISKNQNFERIYRYDGKNLLIDWKISSLACYLIIINCNPINENVARVQLHFAVNQFRK